LLRLLNSGWISPEEAEQISRAPTFGAIPEFEVQRAAKSDNLNQRLAAILEPAGRASEAYRSLGRKLVHSSAEKPPKVTVVTSPGRGEGKSVTCANLGVVLAQAGKSTLVVDCDFRKPMIHKVFGFHNLLGTVDVLDSLVWLHEVYVEAIPGLKVAPAGPTPPDPGGPFRSLRFTEFLARAREEFEYILINAPPTEEVSDLAALASRGDGVLLVLDAQKARRDSVQRSIRNLEMNGARVLGTVVNNVGGQPFPAQKVPTRRPETDRERRTTKRSAGFLEFLIVMLVSFALVFGIMRPFILEPFYIPTTSMVPTLEIGDRVLANKFIYRFAEPERGDIIVFESTDEKKDLVKRVVGLSGDKIAIKGGRLFVNDVLQKEPYVVNKTCVRGLPKTCSYGPVTVPPGHVFVMGDNRLNSEDSRFFGPVPKGNVLGEVFLRLWPLYRLALL
jgi:signal peptidase I